MFKPLPSVISPATGAMQFTRMRSGASSTAIDFDIRFTAPFDELYHVSPGRGRMPAVEVLLNTKLIQDLIEKSDFSGVKEAMDNAMAEGSQTFEEDLARIIGDVLGTTVTAESYDPERIESEDMRAMFTFLATKGYSVDVAALHAAYPQIEWESFADWAQHALG